MNRQGIVREFHIVVNEFPCVYVCVCVTNHTKMAQPCEQFLAFSKMNITALREPYETVI